MAEQRIEVSNVRANNVTVAPTQIIDGAVGPDVRGWTEALVRGPLEHCELADTERRATDLERGGSLQEAAGLLSTIADKLLARGFAPAAEQLRARAARLFREAGDRVTSRSMYLHLAEARLGDGTLIALSYARRAAELSDQSNAWETDGLKALAAWPEIGPGDGPAVKSAFERWAEGTDAVRWGRAAIEFFLLSGENDEALAAAERLRTEHPLAAGDRLSIELEYLALQDPTNQDAGWNDIHSWLSDPSLPVSASGLAWQRRGVMLARRDDSSGARAAFLQAVTQWSRLPKYNDQAAEAYFSALSTTSALHAQRTGEDGRELALAMRGSEQTASSAVERIVRRGLHALIGNRLPDALRELATAVATSRRAGNLSDYFEACHLLGICLERADEPRAALDCFVAAGSVREAKALGGTFSIDELLDQLELDGPLWERTTVWAAIAGAGTTASDEAVRKVVDATFAEVQEAAPRAFPTNAAYYALECLGNVICAVPPSLLARAVELLRERMLTGMGNLNRLADPLFAVTDAGVANESEMLLEELLLGAPYMNQQEARAAPLLRLAPTMRPRFEQAAVQEHNHIALDTLCFADTTFPVESPLAVEAARRIEAFLAAPRRTESIEGDVKTVSIGISGSLAREGLLARSVAAPLRARFVKSILEILGDDELPLMNRVGAVDALFNVAPSIEPSMAKQVAEVLGALAQSQDVLSRLDRLNHDSPLARLRIDMAPSDALRSAALDALGRLAESYEPASELVISGLESALRSGAEGPLRAAMDVLARHPHLTPSWLSATDTIGSPWPSVRIASLNAFDQHDEVAAVSTAEALIDDPSAWVRRSLVGFAERNGASSILEHLASDVDCCVRATARRALRNPDDKPTPE